MAPFAAPLGAAATTYPCAARLLAFQHVLPLLLPRSTQALLPFTSIIMLLLPILSLLFSWVSLRPMLLP